MEEKLYLGLGSQHNIYCFFLFNNATIFLDYAKN